MFYSMPTFVLGLLFIWILYYTLTTHNVPHLPGARHVHADNPESAGLGA